MFKLVIAAVLALFTVAASAQNFYAGAHFGQSKAESTCEGVSGTGVSCDDKGNAWKLLGGYRFHQNFAAELAYTDLGEAKATGPAGSVTATSTAFDLSVVGSFYPIDRLFAYGRLGAYRASTDVKTSTVTVNRTDSETNTGLTYGVGVGYDITKNFTVRAEWQKYPEVGGPSTGEDDITVIGLGVLFRF